MAIGRHKTRLPCCSSSHGSCGRHTQPPPITFIAVYRGAESCCATTHCFWCRTRNPTKPTHASATSTPTTMATMVTVEVDKGCECVVAVAVVTWSRREPSDRKPCVSNNTPRWLVVFLVDMTLICSTPASTSSCVPRSVKMPDVLEYTMISTRSSISESTDAFRRTGGGEGSGSAAGRGVASGFSVGENDAHDNVSCGARATALERRI